MKIGVFDSGLGGLWVLKHIRELMPEYDYVFFADQAYVPYGNKTKEQLFERATKIFKHLYEVEDCAVILIACNTNSTSIYADLKTWAKENYPERQLWGIVKPTIENINAKKDIVFFGTHRTIDSHIYKTESENYGLENVLEIELPELATMIEEGKDCGEYIKSFNPNLAIGQTYGCGVLVCTHYGIVRENFKKAYPEIKNWVYQEDLLPPYIQNYFSKHTDKEAQLSHNATLRVLVSKESLVFKHFLGEWFDADCSIIDL